MRIVSFFQFVFNVLAYVLFLNDKKNNLSFKCKKWEMSYFVEEHVFKELNIKKSVSLPYEKTKEIFLPLIFFFGGGLRTDSISCVIVFVLLLFDCPLFV